MPLLNPPDPYEEETNLELEALARQNQKRNAQVNGGLYQEGEYQVRLPPPNAPVGWQPPLDHNVPRNNRILAPSLQPGAPPLARPLCSPNLPAYMHTRNTGELYSGEGQRSIDIRKAHAQKKREEEERRQRLLARRPPPTGINFGGGSPSLPPRPPQA